MGSEMCIRDRFRGNRARVLGFGVATQLCFLIPGGAVAVMPAAVAGATSLARTMLERTPLAQQTSPPLATLQPAQPAPPLQPAQRAQPAQPAPPAPGSVSAPLPPPAGSGRV